MSMKSSLKISKFFARNRLKRWKLDAGLGLVLTEQKLEINKSSALGKHARRTWTQRATSYPRQQSSAASTNSKSLTPRRLSFRE
jgi:hypothetical protein